MNGLIGKISRVLFDPRVIVAIFGAILSVVMHEMFHVIMHWSEIREIGIFPDRHAIVEIIFQPSLVYDLAVEEGIAYTVTMATLILTAMLVSDIHEARDKRSVQQIILSKDNNKNYSAAQKKKSGDRLARILGINSVARKPSAGTKKK